YAYLINSLLLFFSWLLLIIKFPTNCLKIGKVFDQSMKANWLAYCFIISTILIVFALFFYPNLLKSFLLIIILIVLAFLITSAMKHPHIEHKHLLVLLIFNVFGMCFFAASLQIGSSINLFIERNVNRTI